MQIARIGRRLENGQHTVGVCLQDQNYTAAGMYLDCMKDDNDMLEQIMADQFVR
jgi:hypothetical protein